MEVRVLPAHFARMMDVSKQTVSQWIKRGVITLGADGRVEPKRAARQVLDGTDPARLRARVFREIAQDLAAMRTRLVTLEAEMAAERATAAADAERVAQAVRNGCEDATAEALARFSGALEREFPEGVQAWRSGSLAEWLEALEVREFYGPEDPARCGG